MDGDRSQAVDRREVVTARDVRAADALYVPFPSFRSWEALEVDEDLWESFLQRLESERRAASDDAFRRAVEITMRLAAIDTGAIEGLYNTDRGFTVSVAEQSAVWLVEMEKRGSHVRRLFEAQMAAYQMVFDAATEESPLSEAFIRALHETVTEGQDTYRVLTAVGWQDLPLPKGTYKTQPNHPWRTDGLAHSYAPVAETGSEMHRLMTELRGDSFLTSPAPVQAAYVHYALACVHPFADGNGRVARALASVYLYRAASVPFLVYADQTAAYLDLAAHVPAGQITRHGGHRLTLPSAQGLGAAR